MKRFTRLPSIFGGVALLVFATQAFGDSAACGPGPDWVSSCGGGLYSLSTTSNFNLWLDLNGNNHYDGIGGADWVGFVQTTGTTKINLASSGGSHQMLSDVYQLSETGPDGAKVIAGAGMDSSLYSPGAITARDGSTRSFCDPAAGTATRGTDLSLADSCYEVFFQLTTPASLGSVILHNTSPLRVLCEGLKGVPPFGCQYKWNQQDVLLYDADNITVKGGLLPADGTHHSVPESAAAPQLVGMLLLGALTLRRVRN